MNKRRATAWRVELDQDKFREPREDPWELPPMLRCSNGAWFRQFVHYRHGGISSAVYRNRHHRLRISVHLAGENYGWTAGRAIWVLDETGAPTHLETCETFGEAVALVQSVPSL